MKKIIITGGLGYIGMELAKIYSGLSRYYDVTVLDNKFYSSRVNQLLRWGIKFNQVDILDSINLEKNIKDADLIFHLAGITDVPTVKEHKNQEKNKEIFKVGVVGTRNIIKFSKSDVKIIFPSTHVVFEGLNSLTKNIDEKTTPKPLLEYSKGKLTSEKDLIASKKNYVILWLGSVYGNSYDSTRLNIMPNLFAKLASLDKEIKLFGGGRQLKSLVSVTDVARCMNFVAENNQIKNEIFNCSNENLTVKQVSNICKKFSKNLKITSTNDPIPNFGYSLSNKKLKSLGFKFLFDIETSIKDMIISWSDFKKNNLNEEIVQGKDEYVDTRGIISNYYFDDAINMVGYIESFKGTIRGNHYHPIQTQRCILIKGSYISITKDLKNEHSVIETRLINSRDLSIIPPYVAHTMVFIEDSVFLNLVDGEREHENYGITHTIPYNLVDQQQAKKAFIML